MAATKTSPEAVLLGLATFPWVAALTIAKTVEAQLIDLGRASEEVFRGDRLPVLHISSVPDRPAPEPDRVGHP